MSTLEKKAIALEKIAAIQSETALDEIIAHLEALEKQNSEKKFDADAFFDKAKEKYSDVLQKLAQ